MTLSSQDYKGSGFLVDISFLGNPKDNRIAYKTKSVVNERTHTIKNWILKGVKVSVLGGFVALYTGIIAFPGSFNEPTATSHGPSHEKMITNSLLTARNVVLLSQTKIYNNKGLT